MGLKQYLELLSSTQVKQAKKFVIGNPSVDYDTFFGSIILAYILAATTGHVYMPMIDCPRAQLDIKFDIMGVVGKMNINVDNFVYRSKQSQPYPFGKYTLYDHNERSKIPEVEYIIDHHTIQSDLPTQKYLIRRMGSGLTILYYLLQSDKISLIDPALIKNSHFPQQLKDFMLKSPFQILKNKILIDDDIKEIIRFGILIDTVNFDQSTMMKWTIFDKKAIQFIEKEKDYKLGFDWIINLKYNQTANLNLGLHNNLIKDRKAFTYKAGIRAIYSRIFVRSSSFFSKFNQSLKQQLNINQQKCDIYFIMTAFKRDVNQTFFNREVLYRIKYSQSTKIEEKLQLCFQRFHLEDKGMIEGWRIWEDPTHSISRKFFEPCVEAALDNLQGE